MNAENVLNSWLMGWWAEQHEQHDGTKLARCWQSGMHPSSLMASACAQCTLTSASPDASNCFNSFLLVVRCKGDDSEMIERAHHISRQPTGWLGWCSIGSSKKSKNKQAFDGFMALIHASSACYLYSWHFKKNTLLWWQNIKYYCAQWSKASNMMMMRYETMMHWNHPVIKDAMN